MPEALTRQIIDTQFTVVAWVVQQRRCIRALVAFALQQAQPLGFCRR